MVYQIGEKVLSLYQNMVYVIVDISDNDLEYKLSVWHGNGTLHVTKEQLDKEFKPYKSKRELEAMNGKRDKT